MSWWFHWLRFTLILLSIIVALDGCLTEKMKFTCPSTLSAFFSCSSERVIPHDVNKEKTVTLEWASNFFTKATVKKGRLQTVREKMNLKDMSGKDQHSAIFDVSHAELIYRMTTIFPTMFVGLVLPCERVAWCILQADETATPLLTWERVLRLSERKCFFFWLLCSFLFICLFPPAVHSYWFEPWFWNRCAALWLDFPNQCI